MSITKKEREREKKILTLLGFNLQDGQNGIFQKSYSQHNHYSIVVDINGIGNIDYGNIINAQSDRKTTSNLSQEESIVVLECVDRLLTNGYRPNEIIIEKKFRTEGYLDIMVKRKDESSFALIECKTSKTFKEAWRKMINADTFDKSQLLSYYLHAKESELVILYKSDISNNQIIPEYKYIKIDNKLRSSNNITEVYNNWNKNGYEYGFFENDKPYELQAKPRITKLLDLEEKDGRSIYNQFAEILRNYAISDKANAYNKIFNLFLCKIVDEKKKDGEEYDFQYQDETSQELLKRLSDLYKTGMNEFLKKDISDYSSEHIEKILAGTDTSKQNELKKIFDEIRLYKNNEFSFLEVYDETSFLENAEVVKKIVQILQKYRLRYTHKQPFLGMFFENLLNTGFKQESGQFFTPIPIAKFIVASIPFEQIISQKLKNKKTNFLPYIIDYACGSGHFLTEGMDEINNIIKKLDSKIYDRDAEKKINSYKADEFCWAKEFVYGIEKDYRLVKTAKVSCFLNGDGEANIVHANGLSPFASYKDRLYSAQNDNEVFDILLANPPYSVKQFVNTIDKRSFSIANKFNEKSSEIECLFFERAKQLLSINGMAGIILPASFLRDEKYKEARNVMFRFFKIIAIVELSSNAFAKTGQNTVILFLQKTDGTLYGQINTVINSFFVNFSDVACNGIENLFSLYSQKIHGKTLKDYLEYIKDNKTKMEMEKNRILHFAISYNQKTVVIRVGEKDEAKRFLGYDFSNRRGNEGLKQYKDDYAHITTKLYSSNDVLDNANCNYYIYKNFLNEDITDIDKSLCNNLRIMNLSEIVELDNNINFANTINIKKTKNYDTLLNKYPIIRLYEKEKSDIVIQTGSRPKGGVVNILDGIPSLGGGHIGKNGEIVYNKMCYVKKEFFDNAESGKILANDILLCKDGALTGKVCYIDHSYKYTKSMVNEHVFIIRSNTDKLRQRYLFLFLFSNLGQEQIKTYSGGSAQGGVALDNGFHYIRIPIPPISLQDEIIKSIGNNYKEINEIMTKYLL
jgi:type I restriction enzyme M protein